MFKKNFLKINNIQQKEAIFPPCTVGNSLRQNIRPSGATCSPVSFAIWFWTHGNAAVTGRTIYLFPPHPVVLHKTTRVSRAGEEAAKTSVDESWAPFATTDGLSATWKNKNRSLFFFFFFFLAFYPSWLLRCLWPAGSSFWKERSIQHAGFSYSKLGGG